MKNLKNNINLLILGIISSLMMTSCHDFLDLNPISEQNEKDFYQDVNDIEIAVNGAYHSLYLIYDNYYLFGDIRSDNSTIQTFVFGNSDIDEFSMSTSNNNVAQIWESCYIGISRINIILNRINSIEMDEELRQRYIGEMKFLRGYIYFELARLFGGVPIVLNEVNNPSEGFSHTRSELSDVYDLIEQDLLDAIEMLELSYTGADVGRATKGAARALLAKVYLTQDNKSAALTQLEEVIISDEYELLFSYADIFAVDNGNNAEILFSVNYQGGGTGTGNPFTNRFAPKAAGEIVTGIGQAVGNNVPEQSLLDAYEEGDDRFDATISMGYVNAEGEFVEDPYTKKFHDPGMVNAFDGSNDWPILRYSDVLLMYAEALGESTEAYNFINKVRQRAGLGHVDENTPGTFIEKLLQERRVEFAFEGHRWFDLVRLNQFIPVMNAEGTVPHTQGNVVEEHHKVFPIPQQEIDVNPNIIQNVGYTF